jgi:hypothetical protein
MSTPGQTLPPTNQQSAPAAQVDLSTHAPRISWSVIVMAIGMIISAAFNYATYDTRITILEKKAISDDGDKQTLIHKLEQVTDLAQKSEVHSIGDSRDIANLSYRVDRIESRLDHIAEKKGK